MQSLKKLEQRIKNGEYDKVFFQLYSSDEQVCKIQKERYLNAISEFEGIYGSDRDICIYSAPGRTEIGGNHTDHNNGKVMAAAVNLDIIAVVSQNIENLIRVKSKGFKNEDVIDLSDLSVNKREINSSASLVRGICARVREKGGNIGGFDAYTTSDVLRGSGLSSSAAFEVILGAIVNGEYNSGKFSAVEIAQIGQYAENVYFGKPSGLMDQSACSIGGAITIDFKDNDNPIVESLKFDLAKNNFALCITDTKGSHANLTDEYAAIKTEMQSVANAFDKQVLRQIDKSDVLENMAKLRQTLSDRAVLRALHFFEENERVMKLSDSIRNNNFEQFLKVIISGGHSSFEYNQNAYSVNNPSSQGVSIGLAVSQNLLENKGAWRLQGGGFAGTIQAFVPKDEVENYKNAMNNIFGENSCYVLNVRNFGAINIDEAL